MEYDIRYLTYTFKHSYSPMPDTSQERFKEHYHTLYELLYFVQGDASFSLQHTRYNIKPGSLLLTKPGEYHNIIFHSTAPYERYVIRFSPMAILEEMKQKLDTAQSVYYIKDTPIAQAFAQLDEHLSLMQSEMKVPCCLGFMYVILSHLISAQNLKTRADYVNVDSKKILDYIDAHLHEIHSVADIASALHMSRSSLYRIISDQLDVQLMTYVRIRKCLFARNLLHQGASPTEVASQLGFSHYSSFYRDYMQVFHESPSALGR
ncbi:MAG: AraC family transcriptional regulator [Firmicutes bacterium]|nr:AraC family transcriptional regulator [Bacillota bacterium]